MFPHRQRPQWDHTGGELCGPHFSAFSAYFRIIAFSAFLRKFPHNFRRHVCAPVATRSDRRPRRALRHNDHQARLFVNTRDILLFSYSSSRCFFSNPDKFPHPHFLCPPIYFPLLNFQEVYLKCRQSKAVRKNDVLSNIPASPMSSPPTPPFCAFLCRDG